MCLVRCRLIVMKDIRRQNSNNNVTFVINANKITYFDCTDMKAISNETANGSSRSESRLLEDNSENRSKAQKRYISRRSFLGNTIRLGSRNHGRWIVSKPPNCGSKWRPYTRGRSIAAVPSGAGNTRGRLLDPIQRARRCPGLGGFGWNG